MLVAVCVFQKRKYDKSHTVRAPAAVVRNNAMFTHLGALPSPAKRAGKGGTHEVPERAQYEAPVVLNSNYASPRTVTLDENAYVSAEVPDCAQYEVPVVLNSDYASPRTVALAENVYAVAEPDYAFPHAVGLDKSSDG